MAGCQGTVVKWATALETKQLVGLTTVFDLFL